MAEGDEENKMEDSSMPTRSDQGKRERELLRVPLRGKRECVREREVRDVREGVTKGERDLLERRK